MLVRPRSLRSNCNTMANRNLTGGEPLHFNRTHFLYAHRLSRFHLRGDLETSDHEFFLCRWQKGWWILYMTPKRLIHTSVCGRMLSPCTHINMSDAHTTHRTSCHSIFSKDLHRFYASVQSNDCSVLCRWLGDFSCILALLEALNTQLQAPDLVPLSLNASRKNLWGV